MSPEETVVEVRKRLAAAPARVFGAFADPELVSRWLTPAPEIRLSVLQLDFRVGGAYRLAYTVPDGQTMIVNGIYRTIEPPRTIVFSWNIEPPDEHAGLQSEVTVTIAPDGEGSELCIRHTKLTQPGAASRHAQGWRGALDQFAALVDPHPRGKHDR
jgi:uncharacterized protein YndB with AHSA1/START domain